jgi:hypothetical protein
MNKIPTSAVLSIGDCGPGLALCEIPGYNVSTAAGCGTMSDSRGCVTVSLFRLCGAMQHLHRGSQLVHMTQLGIYNTCAGQNTVILVWTALPDGSNTARAHVYGRTDHWSPGARNSDFSLGLDPERILPIANTNSLSAGIFEYFFTATEMASKEAWRL